MNGLEQILGLFVAAVIIAAAARRIGAPYPVFLAIGGALLAFLPTYAVWEPVVFALNILAFIFIGLQIRPILESLEAAKRGEYFVVAGAVLLTVILVRPAWHMFFNAIVID
jgi:hypothetical protein